MLDLSKPKAAVFQKRLGPIVGNCLPARGAHQLFSRLCQAEKGYFSSPNGLIFIYFVQNLFGNVFISFDSPLILDLSAHLDMSHLF